MQDAQPSHQRVSLRLLVGLLLVSFIIDVTAMMMVIPLLVQMADDFNTSVAAMGQTMTALSVAWGVTAPLMGPVSDRYGRKVLFVLGMIGFGLATVGIGFAWSYASIMIIRFIGGAAGGVYGPMALTIIGDQVPARLRGRALGIVMSGVPVAFIGGVPAMTWLAAHSDWRWSFWVTGGLLVLMAAVATAILPSDRPRRGTSTGYLAAYVAAIRRPFAAGLLVSNGAQQLSYYAFTTYLGAFLIVSYGIRLEYMAGIMAIVFVGPLVGSYLGGYLSDRCNRVMMCVLGLALAGVFALPFMALPVWLPLSLALAALSGGMNNAARPAYVSMITQVSSERRGTMMGMNTLSNQIGASLGSALGGVMLGAGGYPALGALVAVTSIASALGFRMLVQDPHTRPGVAEKALEA